MTYADIELDLLRELELKVIAVLVYSGWNDDCDKDAADAFDELKGLHLVMDNLKKLLPAPTPGEHK